MRRKPWENTPEDDLADILADVCMEGFIAYVNEMAKAEAHQRRVPSIPNNTCGWYKSPLWHYLTATVPDWAYEAALEQFTSDYMSGELVEDAGVDDLQYAAIFEVLNYGMVSPSWRHLSITIEAVKMAVDIAAFGEVTEH